MYQDWADVIFLHWKVDAQLLLPHIPQGITLDLFEGDAYVTLVAFTVRNAHPRYIPPIAGIADFDEVNLRTYVTDGVRPGITFLDIKANNLVQVMLNRLVGLPYKRAAIHRENTASAVSYYSMTGKHQKVISLVYKVEERIEEKAALDKWLSERYCNYQQVGGRLYRYNIHHYEWPLMTVSVEGDINYTYEQLSFSLLNMTAAHYSKGVNVLFWWRQLQVVKRERGRRMC